MTLTQAIRRMFKPSAKQPDSFVMPAHCHPGKIDVLRRVFETLRPQSFADLGGTWNVDGAYTFFLLNNYPVDRAVLADWSTTPIMHTMATKHPQLSLLEGALGSPRILSAIGTVDCVLLFDVLLHQINPDWKEMLTLYSRLAPTFVIFNPQYVGGSQSIRLQDLDDATYARVVPDAMTMRGEPRSSDDSAFWQWGITNRDLSAHMAILGYTLAYEKSWNKMSEAFENYAFIFQKSVDR